MIGTHKSEPTPEQMDAAMKKQFSQSRLSTGPFEAHSAGVLRRPASAGRVCFSPSRTLVRPRQGLFSTTPPTLSPSERAFKRIKVTNQEEAGFA